ncbi:integrase core domain-containing protein [Mameliella alba]|uniref:integrase core domain-containing protein n=1 Tax=Mameliella alba TaxID=561184 RepID=UPI0009E2D35E
MDSASVAGTAYAEPGLPWENLCCASFNARSGEKMFSGGLFCSPSQALAPIERRRKHRNTKRPHGALGYHPPVPETIVPMDRRPVILQHSNWTFRMGPIMAIEPQEPGVVHFAYEDHRICPAVHSHV